MSKDVFITEDFMLETEAARRLFHQYAKDMPIIDYHCHLDPREVAEDKSFKNMTEIWLAQDHYKWRAMRANGVSEEYVTGNAADWDKFEKWAETTPRLLRNPLYHWTHLELKNPFGISDRLLCPETAKGVWDEGNAMLQTPAFSARSIMKRMKVVLVCTTDDPTDTLEHHKAIAADSAFNIKVLPTWRPDWGIAVELPDKFNAWLDKLSGATDIDIRDFASYMEALNKRHEYFHEAGCRLSDHGLRTIYAEDYTHKEIEAIFLKVRGNTPLAAQEILQFKSAMLHEFGKMDHGKGWTQQYHVGVLRNNRGKLFETFGPDAGADSMGDLEIARPLARWLDGLDKIGKLAKTIFYNLNPRDSMLICTMLGNFQDGPVPGKMQYGSGWWYQDQKDGMEQQLEVLSQIGLLSRFVGMVTDSRSFLSYTRHEYFRRILCNLLGNDIAKGLLPNDIELAGKLVQDISYNNAASYFGIDVPAPGGV